MNTKLTVLIFQTDRNFLEFCKTWLTSTEELEIHYFNDGEEVSKHLVPGARQMLITSSGRHKKQNIAEWLDQLRQINPELVVASFSTIHLEGDFDHHISKVGRDVNVRKNLRFAIECFQSGWINRKQTAQVVF